MVPNPADTPAPVAAPTAPDHAADSPAAGDSVNGVAAAPPPTPSPLARRRRWIIIGVVAAAALVLFLVFGLPWLLHYFSHESTDDAYVNSHVTYLAPRVTGNVTEVLAEDNQYVEQGAPLVRLDSEPYRVTVEQRRAALDHAKLMIDQQVAALHAAEAELAQARDQARAQVAALRGQWYLLETIQYLVRYQIAGLRSSVANLKLAQANLALAEKEYQRVRTLASRGEAASREELEQRQADLRVAQEKVNAAQEAVQQTRAMIGLPRNTAHPEDIPKDLENTFAGVQYALSSGQQILANLGLPLAPIDLEPATVEKRLGRLEQDRTLLDQAASVRVAEAHVHQARAALGGDAYDPAHPYNNPAVVQAQKDLEQAQLQLGYTEIRAPIAGYVSRRAVNPGNHVDPGQALLALRPLQDWRQVWVDANFKETQLKNLRIGQPVDLYVDAYPGQVFHGRVAGFSSGTGAALSLLPPENATGNFVKVVQRLPVRIELTGPVPQETPLFAGLSVVPEVSTQAPPEGPGAGQRLLGPGQ